MRPDDDFLAKSIAAAFDRLPEPEAARLEGLERRLSLQAAPRVPKRVRARFWWLLAGLVATGAAAWWGGQYLKVKPRPTAAGHEVQHEIGPTADTEVENGSVEQPKPVDSTGSGEREYEIFRREKY